MTVRVYKSTDVGAPSLTSAAGSLISVLDACLVTGYGSQSPAGWTKEYSGTNKAVYRQGSLATYNQYYLRVDNANSTYAIATGYESMTDVDTGTRAFPHSTQLTTGGVVWATSNTGVVPRMWQIIATERAFYYWGMYTADTPPAGQSWWYAFGDFVSTFGSDDKWNCMIVGHPSTSITSSNHATTQPYSTGVSSSIGRYIARSRDGMIDSVPFNMATDFRYYYSSTALSAHSYTLTPNPTDDKLFAFPVTLVEPVFSLTYAGTRGTMPALLAMANGLPTVSDSYLQPNKQYILHGDELTFPSLVGKTYQAIASRSGALTTSYLPWLIETSDTW